MRSSLSSFERRVLCREVEEAGCWIPVSPLFHLALGRLEPAAGLLKQGRAHELPQRFPQLGLGGSNVPVEGPRTSRCRNSRGARSSAQYLPRARRWRSCEREGGRRPSKKRYAASACSERQCLALVTPACSRRSNEDPYFAVRPSGLYGMTWALLQQHKAISLYISPQCLDGGRQRWRFGVDCLQDCFDASHERFDFLRLGWHGDS